MKKYDDTLFQIGEVAKMMEVTRKTLLVYEEAGLLVPAVKDADSGYRYYSADNMTQIRAIRSLQSLGLTLKEVKEYYYDVENIDLHLRRLMDLRAELDHNIQMLQCRAAKRGDLSVRRVILPRQVCFCRRHECENVAQAAALLRNTYLAAAHTGKLSMNGRMFTARMTSAADKLDILCCIPVEESYDGPYRREFAETSALCIYYRGPYEQMGEAIRALAAYVATEEVEVTGPFRSIYLEGPPNRGEKSGDYITQVAVPIREN